MNEKNEYEGGHHHSYPLKNRGEESSQVQSQEWKKMDYEWMKKEGQRQRRIMARLTPRMGDGLRMNEKKEEEGGGHN